MAETFVEWLRLQVERWPTVHAFAVALEVEDNVVHAWLYRNIVPRAGMEDRLATVTKTPVQTIVVMMNEARKVAWAARLARQQRRKPDADPLLSRKPPTKVGTRLHRGELLPALAD